MTRALLQALEPGGVCLTADQLAAAAGKPYRLFTADLAAAYKAGLIQRADRGCYAITAAGRAALAGGHELTPEAPAPRGGASWIRPYRQRLWDAMRSTPKWCRADIMALATLPGSPTPSPDSTRDFIAELSAAGYLVRLQGRMQVSMHPSAGQMRYRLIRDTGPLSPQVRRTGEVYDRNLRRVVTAESWS